MTNKIEKISNTAVYVDDEGITGGVNYVHTVNDGTDVVYGCPAMATIDFICEPDIFATGDAVRWYCKQIADTTAQVKGLFVIQKITKYKNKVKVFASDYMCKFDKVVDSWLAGLYFPISLLQIIISLADYCGVARGPLVDTNYNFRVPATFRVQNLNGRTMLRYIAEVMGAYAKIDEDGRLVFRRYRANTTAIDNTMYKTYEHEDFVTAAITKVQARITDKDIGVSYGSSDTNVYVVQDNPLFYDNTSATIQTALRAIYNGIATTTYTPGTITLSSDRGINAGDKIVVNGTDTFIVMEKRITASGVTLSSTGNKLRDYSGSTGMQEIERLYGKTFEMSITAEGMTAAITTAAGGTTKAVFNEDGISIYNGGFRIKDADNNDVFYADTGGSLTLRGKIYQRTESGIDMYINNGTLRWTDTTIQDSPVFAAISFDSSRQQLSIFPGSLFVVGLYMGAFDSQEISFTTSGTNSLVVDAPFEYHCGNQTSFGQRVSGVNTTYISLTYVDALASMTFRHPTQNQIVSEQGLNISVSDTLSLEGAGMTIRSLGGLIYLMTSNQIIMHLSDGDNPAVQMQLRYGTAGNQSTAKLYTPNYMHLSSMYGYYIDISGTPHQLVFSNGYVKYS